MSDDHHGRQVGGELIAELGALLARAAGATSEPEPRVLRAAADPVAQTRLQEYANELAELCRRVLAEADEETGRAFWQFLIETAARHGPRAGERPS